MSTKHENYTTLRTAVEELQTLAFAATDKKRPSGALFAKQLNAVDKTVAAVKYTFGKILNNLKQIDFKKIDETTLEEMAVIITKAEEISVCLDKYTSLFEKEVKEVHIKAFKEYLALKDFYEEILKSRQTRIFVVKQENRLKEQEPVFHVEKTEQEKFLEQVKEDKTYDLFYLKSEEGKPFYDTSFIRHLQFKPKDYKELEFEDPFIPIKAIQDKELQMLSDKLLTFVKKPLENFFKGFASYKRNDNVRVLVNAVFALSLAADSHNLLRNIPKKPSHNYFFDFQMFLRQVLDSFTYKQWSEKDRKELNDFEKSFIDLVNGLSSSLYLTKIASKESVNHIARLVKRITDQQTFKGSSSEYLNFIYDNLEQYLKKFPNGPVLKALDHLLYENHPGFDPILDGNLPYKLFDKEGIEYLHIPSPTWQVLIHKAKVIDEFKAFLKYLQIHKKKLLLINFQDRTSWREHARCRALEALQNEAEFSKTIFVASFAKDTDFYNQVGSYTQNNAQEFLQHVKENIISDSCGFNYPKDLIDKGLFNQIKKIVDEVHADYFSKKNVLSQKERKLFIDIVYYKIVHFIRFEISANCVGISCKDGIDSSAAFELVIYLEALKKHELTQEIKDIMIEIAFLPAFYQRDRLISREDFKRSINLLNNL
jgi:hypothetical protein